MERLNNRIGVLEHRGAYRFHIFRGLAVIRVPLPSVESAAKRRP